MAHRPVTQAERDQVAELHAAGKSRADIGRQLGRSATTIGRIGEQLGLSWDRTRTAAATAARSTDLAARRAELAALLLDDAFKIRERLYKPYTVVGFSKDGEPLTVELTEPPAAELRNIMTTIGIAVDKHLVLARADADTSGRAAVDAWLAAMMGGQQ